MSKHKRIFIVGHSGAGKGVLAQALSKKLGWQFLDADFSLEKHVPSILKAMEN
jgi:shikimate kinase